MRRLLMLVSLGGAVACGGPSAPDGSVPDGGLAQRCDGGPASFELRVLCTPGVAWARTVDAGLPGYTRVDLGLWQPVDHFGDAGVFVQRVSLLHRSEAAPMVLSTSGYFLSTRRREVTITWETNQLSYEHRYFASSTPEPRDFRYNTLRQTAADAHRLVATFKPLYPGPWVSTGASRGGMTSVYHRRHYPADVAGTVAYVAPVCDAVADPRYAAFVGQVGASAFPACRQRLVELQRALLTRRDEVLPLVDRALTFDRVGADRVVEHAAIEAFFAFWQYKDPADATTGCASLPSPTGTAQQLHDFVEDQVGWAYFSDAELDAYAGYYHAAATEEGGPMPYEAELAGLLRWPGTDVVSSYSPVAATWDPAPQRDVTEWVEREGQGFLFVYGELDPWSAGQYRVTPAPDNAVLYAPGGNHGSAIASLGAADQATARAMLTRWLGKAPVRKLSRREGEAAQAPERWPR